MTQSFPTRRESDRGVTFLNGADCDFSKWQEHGEAWVDSRLKCEFLGFLWGFLSSRKACDARISAFGLDERRTVYWLVQTGRSVKQVAMELNRHPDRKSDVSGKRVSVRVVLGGRLYIQKK